MNKFLFVFVSLCLFAPIHGLRRNRLKEFHRRRLNGDLHPKHRRLSQNGQLHLKVDGRGYFQFRLRVDADEISMTKDASQESPSADGSYNQAYMDADNTPAANAKGSAHIGKYNDGNPGANGVHTSGADSVEGVADGDANFFSQVVYGRDGSLHVNRYGYLVDDNGLLLVSDATLVTATPEGDFASYATRTSDNNAKHHIHIPSRAEDVLVTPTGKVMAVELGGAAFTRVGQIRLARFENAQGLNIRLKMNSNCNAANEDGFALGNWCAGTALDGKEHTYFAETEVSGRGILGNPGSQGFGRIVKVK